MRLLLLSATLAASLVQLASAQFAITSYTIDAGGGTSSGGSFSLSGTIGQPDASAPSIGGGFTLTGGFWEGADTGPSLFAPWANANLPSNADKSFDGDGDGDGIPNGIAYVFGNTAIQPVGNQPAGTGRIPAPPSIPADVNVYLEASAVGLSDDPLEDWNVIISWENGNPPNIDAPGFNSIIGNEVVSIGLGSTYFFRYRVELR